MADVSIANAHFSHYITNHYPPLALFAMAAVLCLAVFAGVLAARDEHA